MSAQVTNGLSTLPPKGKYNYGKKCSTCIYTDGRWPDMQPKCTDRARQFDTKVLDCCVPEAPLRELQAAAQTGADYAQVTLAYVQQVKLGSRYWRKHNSVPLVGGD